jgi:DNA replication protein DnaC
LELIDRERRMVERRIKAAKFPTVKSLDSFDFAAFGALGICRAAREHYRGRQYRS